MSILTRLDDLLVDSVAQPVVNKTGIDPAAAARSMFIGDAVFTSCEAMARYVAGSLTTPYAVMSAIVIVVAVGLAWRQADAPASGLAPATRHAGRLLRSAGVFLVAWNFLVMVLPETTMADLFLAAGITAFVLGLYLGACRRPPPKPVTERNSALARAGAR